MHLRSIYNLKHALGISPALLPAIVLAVILPLILFGIGSPQPYDPRLEAVAVYIDSKPSAAIDSLAAIDTVSFSERDRAFFSLLTVKARDKAYIRHTSDSLAKAVLRYYTEHRDDRLTPEAMYYAGRVAYDLGDYPSARQYFEEALLLLPSNTPHKKLRGAIISQTGGLLNDMGLYKDAKPYLKEVIGICHTLNDTLNLALDYKLLGAIQLHLKELDSAMYNFKTAEKWAHFVSRSDVAEMRAYMSSIYLRRGNVAAALSTARHTPDSVDLISRNIVLSNAAKAYLEAGILDTAYMYAHELALSKMPDNRKIGYRIMLLPELRHFLPKDSIDFFYSDYKEVLEAFALLQQDRQALIQASMYNYAAHDRERQSAENKLHKAHRYILYLLIFILSIIASFFYRLFRQGRKIIQLHSDLAKAEALAKILKETIDGEKGVDETNHHDKTDNTDKVIEDTAGGTLADILKEKDEDILRKSLREKYREISIASRVRPSIPSGILESPVYMRLQSLIEEERMITDGSGLWEQLQCVIDNCCPDFSQHLLKLAGAPLPSDELHIALLVKAGFSHSQMTILIGKTKGIVTYRRKKLSKTLFGETLDTVTIDNIIRLL